MPVNSLAWSPDSAMFVSGSLDKNAIVWDAAACTPVHFLQGHEGFLKGVAWDPIGSYVATLSDDQNVHLWATKDWTPVDTIAAVLAHMSGNLLFCRCAGVAAGRCAGPVEGNLAALQMLLSAHRDCTPCATSHLTLGHAGLSALHVRLS